MKLEIPIRNKAVFCYYIILLAALVLTVTSVITVAEYLKTGGVCFPTNFPVRIILVMLGAGLALIFFAGATRPMRYSVEGPYLVISHEFIFHYTRKIHFRDLSDYKSWSDPLMRVMGFGVVSAATTGGGNNNRRVFIIGIENPGVWRDKLCEIDEQSSQSDHSGNGYGKST